MRQTVFEFDIDEVKALVQGNFKFRPCLLCSSSGWYWVDNELGEIVTAPHPAKDIGWYSQQSCDACIGLGGYIKFN